ncbi:anthocyanin 5-aromatic acyltransferase-like [Abrus precatorius]|uniref:Anthocyanin 5-aromatic acyltransferase-like n=1 Tax=Abrus precatorius TaxID=3816 RepID=A0A8B8KGV2_ABRPR|nr:anthocyanin 5-aromatic acyltransferase-like [Abrus precatorius]
MSNTHFTVNVLEQCRITPPPNTTPTTSILPLTFFDLPWLFFSPSQPLFFYEFPTFHFTTTILPKLKQSLSLTLQHYYPFAGSFVPSHDHSKPHLIYTNNNSVPLTISESNGNFNHFCSNHIRDVKDFHLLVPKLACEGNEFPLLAIQVTLFPRVGICIGITFHHVVADGRTFHNFFKTWASYCSSGSASTFRPKSLPCCDRSVIVDANGLEEVFLKEWKKRGLAQGIAIGREAKLVDLSVLVRATFLMGTTQMEKIKCLIINCCKDKNQPQPVHLSAYVLACAFTWVCLLKTQQSVNVKAIHEDNTYLGFIAGGITRLDYAVPMTYLGNCVGFGRASVKREDILGEDGVVAAAKAIGSTIKKLDASIFAGAEKWILDWDVLHGSKQHVYATWSPKLKPYELDFGWGRPKKIEEISIDFTGAFSLIQSRDIEGGIEIGLALPKNEMDTFSILFTKGLDALP